MFLLNYEKACDSIEWRFIQMMLECLGFPEAFNKNGASPNGWYINNGRNKWGKIRVFSLSRSIRQGCPLAPSLFAIVVDSLHYISRDNSLSPKVKGINLPNKEELVKVQFVDDTSLLIDLSEINASNLTKKLDLFCKTSGSKVYIAKSIMLRVNQPPTWYSKFIFS